MSQGPLDRSTFEAIEAYVLDRMDVEERAAFEQRMATDPALRAEVELERENIRAVELGGISRMLKALGDEEVTGQAEALRGGAWKQRLRYAAVVAIILSGSLWLLRPSANERLFAEHFVADPGMPVAMGSADDPAFADAMVSYKEGKYTEARAKWMSMFQQEPMNDTLRYYIGAAALAEGDAAAAIPHLVTTAQDSSSGFRARARWFLFLAYVRANDLTGARSIDLSGDAIRAEEAKAILAELPR